MYNAKERKQRYLDHLERDRQQARNHYTEHADSINTKRREKYNKNIVIEREKVRLRVAAHRAKTRKSQNDTNIKKTPGK